MVSIIPISHHFDQQTIRKIIAADALVQRYRALFALLDWSPLDTPGSSAGPGRPAHPKSAFAKAFLVRVCEKKASMPALRAFLLEHPLLVLELGFRPTLAVQEPYGFDVQRTLPTVRWLNEQLRTFDPRRLSDLFAQTIQARLASNPWLRRGRLFRRDPSLCQRQRAQSAPLRQRALQPGPATQRRSRLPPRRQTLYQPRASRWKHDRRERVPVGLWLRPCQCLHPRLRGCRARPVHATVQRERHSLLCSSLHPDRGPPGLFPHLYHR
jgi:hypothetical protein